MVLEFCGSDALYCRSVTNNPAATPPSGTNQVASCSRIWDGLVQICFWSSMKSLMCPVKSRRVGSLAATSCTPGSANLPASAGDASPGLVADVSIDWLSLLVCDRDSRGSNKKAPATTKTARNLMVVRKPATPGLGMYVRNSKRYGGGNLGCLHNHRPIPRS